MSDGPLDTGRLLRFMLPASTRLMRLELRESIPPISPEAAGGMSTLLPSCELLYSSKMADGGSFQPPCDCGVIRRATPRRFGVPDRGEASELGRRPEGERVPGNGILPLEVGVESWSTDKSTSEGEGLYAGVKNDASARGEGGNDRLLDDEYVAVLPSRLETSLNVTLPPGGAVECRRDLGRGSCARR